MPRMPRKMNRSCSSPRPAPLRHAWPCRSIAFTQTNEAGPARCISRQALSALTARLGGRQHGTRLAARYAAWPTLPTTGALTPAATHGSSPTGAGRPLRVQIVKAALCISPKPSPRSHQRYSSGGD